MSEAKLTPTDVEYLFRAVRTDLSSMLNRMGSLVDNAGATDEAADALTEARALMLRASGRVATAENLMLKRVFPHRANAGELEDW